MSDELQEVGCGKATMYVITEKGLEIGPFVYNRDTDSRVLCANTGHIYYSQGGQKQRNVEDPNNEFPRREIIQKRKLKIVDLGAASLPFHSASDEFTGSQNREMENWGLMSGNFRSKYALKSGKQRQTTAEQKNIEDKSEEDSNLNLKIIKHLLKNDKDYCDMSSVKKKEDLSLNGKRQLVLRRLRMKRQSEVLLEEIAKLRQTSAALIGEDEADREENDKKRNMRLLKRIFYPHPKPKVESERHVLPHLPLPLIKLSHVRSKQKELNEKPSNSKATDQKLVFLTPRIQYNQSKAPEKAKMNINECKVKDNAKPKVRFPAVIDQRTGEMHSVPGVVTFRQSDYNKWSRRQNIIRRETKSSRSPSLTYVSFLPSVTGDTTNRP